MALQAMYDLLVAPGKGGGGCIKGERKNRFAMERCPGCGKPSECKLQRRWIGRRKSSPKVLKTLKSMPFAALN